MHVLGGLTPAVFLRDWWQKKPLMVRGGFPGFTSPLSSEGLLALACRDSVSSRLIMEEGGRYPWELLVGPFEPEDFRSLPPRGWTILVGDVDRHVPAVAEILTPFRFLPNWRIDDVQVSYAPPGGNAGPHVDNYDVFLVQGQGQRRWQISHVPAPEDVALVENADMALLEEFAPDTEWVLSPGDLLYLPPRIPHLGVALGPCMTYSVGFRAPAAIDILHGLLDAAVAREDGAERFGDAGRAPSAEPGRLAQSDLDWVRRAVRRLVPSDAAVDRWFGAYITRPADELVRPEVPFQVAEVLRILESGCVLRRVSVGLLAHMGGGGCTRLYACGKEFVLEGALSEAARLLTGVRPLTLHVLKPYLSEPTFAAVLTELVNMGCIMPVER